MGDMPEIDLYADDLEFNQVCHSKFFHNAIVNFIYLFSSI